jgi:hypothetical protein
MPQVQALQGVPRGFHAAARVIQSLLRFKRARKLRFEKHLDTATGRFFFKNTHTLETTWDTPAGAYPLARPPPATLQGLSLEKAMRQSRKQHRSAERNLLIALRREEYHRGLKDRAAKGAGAAHRAALEVWNDAFRVACLTGELKVGGARTHKPPGGSASGCSGPGGALQGERECVNECAPCAAAPRIGDISLSLGCAAQAVVIDRSVGAWWCCWLPFLPLPLALSLSLSTDLLPIPF